MVETISSLQNKTIKDTAKLVDKKYRQQTGLFMLEGLKLVQELLDSAWQIDSVFLEQNLELPAAMQAQLLERSVNLYYVTKEIIAKIADVSTAQGIIAIAKMQPQQMPDFPQDATVLLLENIQDPGNMGTIIRTAVATGISAIIVTPDCADIYSPKVVRSTMGGMLRLPIVTMPAQEALSFLQAHQFPVYVTSLTNAASLYSAQFTGRAAIVLGNEANGVSSETLAHSPQRIFIPQIGKIESLNVSIAAGVIMYEVLRQKLASGAYPSSN